MKRLAKIFILAAAVISVIFLGAPSSTATAAPENFCGIKKICPPSTDNFTKKYLDFWSKFRDTVMPDEPQDNNPPKEMKRPPPVKPKPVNPKPVNPKPVEPKPAQPPQPENPEPAD